MFIISAKLKINRLNFLFMQYYFINIKTIKIGKENTFIALLR